MSGRMKVIRPLGHPQAGHQVIEWNVAVAPQVESAGEAFARLLQEGYTAYAFKTADGPGEVVDTFDPETEKYIMSPRMVGG